MPTSPKYAVLAFSLCLCVESCTKKVSIQGAGEESIDEITTANQSKDIGERGRSPALQVDFSAAYSRLLSNASKVDVDLNASFLQMLLEIASVDPEWLLRFLALQDNATLRDWCFENIAETIFKADPDLAMSHLEQFNERSKAGILSMYASLLFTRDGIDAAIRVLDEHSDMQQSASAYAYLFNTIIDSGWTQASLSLSLLPYGTTRTLAISNAITRFSKEPKEVIQFVSDLKEVEDRRRGILSLRREISRLSRESADALMSDLRSTGINLDVEIRKSLVSAKFRDTYNQEFDSLVKEARTLTNSEMEETAIMAAISSFAGYSPEKVTENWRLIATDPQMDSYANAFASAWENIDPSAANQWIASELSPGEVRTKLLERSFRKWLKSNPEKASQWLGSNLALPERDQLIGEVGSYLISKSNYTEALEWVETLNDVSLRDKLLSRIQSALKTD